MSRARIIGAVIAFVLDTASTAFVVWSPGTEGQRAANLALLLGRVLGLSLLALLAVRAGLGRWPQIFLRRQRRPQGAVREVPLEAVTEAPGRALLLEAANGLLEGATPRPGANGQDGDARARQIDATLAAQKDLLKKVETGIWVRNALLIVAYLYVSACSMWTAAVIVGLSFPDTASVLSGVAQVLMVILMNVEFPLLKGTVMALTEGAPVHLKGVHEHPLYWTDVEGKGWAKCSSCDEKIGQKSGGYLTLQCRICQPSHYGWGGFQVCMHCYRKNAVKFGDAGSSNASGAGILRTDSGPKVPVELTTLRYMRRLAGIMPFSTIVIMMVTVCGSQFVSTYIPKSQGDCITALVNGDHDEFDRNMAIFATLAVASALMSFAMSVAISILSTRLYNNMAVQLFRALLRQDIAFYDNAMTGQLTSRLQNDLRQAVSPVQIIINSFVANIIMLVVGFVICLQSSWRLTLLAFTFLAPLVHITAEFSKWAGMLMASQFTFMADAQGSATQALTNIRTVRSFGARDLELEKYEKHMVKSMLVGLRSAWGQGGANLLSGLVQQGASFIILYYGGYLALGHKGFNVGSIITFTYLWNRLSSGFRGLNDNLNAPVKAMSAGQRVFEVMDLQPDIQEDQGEAFPTSRDQVTVQFRDVDFTYQSRPDKKVLKAINLTIAAGQTTAVVGKSGCGKSTLTKLLLRFYDPQGGSVLLNSVDLRKMHLLDYRGRVGVVSQDTQLFRATVADNITYGMREESFTMQDVELAASKANVADFIRELPEGYQTMCGEGGHDFSGGQKQRLSIARALVRRPRLLLLDEATSALDAENEELVQKALDILMLEMQGTCTILVIAHRLSTIKDANRIVVLHEGEVVEEGRHDELVQKKDGRYATMIARQLHGGQGADDVDDATGEEKLAKEATSEISRLLNALQEAQRGEVLRSIMTSFRKSLGKGSGK